MLQPSAINPLNPGEWVPLNEAFEQFVASHPELGYSSSRYSAARFARAYYPELQRAGVMVRTHSRRYLCHREKFTAAAFTMLVERREELL